jgi:DNA-binding transcriptional LysR family regulator
MLPSLNSISSRLRFRQLRLLVAIDDLGSLHRAAEQVGLTQPGATKALHEIETTFGTQLFVRSTQGIEANELGRCVIRYARLFHSDLNHLRQEIAGALLGEGGRLAVGAITGALPALVVRAVAAVRKQQPSLSIELREDTSADLLAALTEGRLDLAICRIAVAVQPALFDYLPLCEEQVAIAVGPHHSLVKARKVTWAELAHMPWICYPSHLPLRTLLEREFKQAGLPFPAYPIETPSTFATILMLQEDPPPVTLLSAETLKLYRVHKLAFPLALPIRSRSEPYGIVTRRGWALSPAATMLIRELQKQAPAMA